VKRSNVKNGGNGRKSKEQLQFKRDIARISLQIYIALAALCSPDTPLAIATVGGIRVAGRAGRRQSFP
jgi:hypothetical protein